MIPERFKEFEETELYMDFGECFIFPEIYDTSKIEYYKSRLDSLKLHIGFEFVLMPDNVERYIKRINYINDADIPKFFTFVGVIVEKYTEYIKNLKDYYLKEIKLINKKNITNRLNEPKNIEKQKEIDNRNAKRVERELQKKILQEQLQKKQEDKQNIKNQEKLRILLGKTIIRCECGISVMQYKMNIHMVGKDHIIGMNAINYYKSIN
jgi:hypothetical protein